MASNAASLRGYALHHRYHSRKGGAVTEISLQDYCDRIENLIEQGRYAEVVAHGRHILAFHPKYVLIYRLLGTALLEAGQDEYAEDMFRRVLSADPEDYLAWAGMSDVLERRGDLISAIWFLERAFELASDSTVLEEHLGELRSRRDGVLEEHVDLTRAALARLYIRGDLPSRAISELSVLVAENPERPDLMLALAEAYWRDDQRVEASDLCQQVLNELPYCLKANLILVDIWRETGRDEAGLYWRRAQALDPENRVAHELLGSSAGPVQEVVVPLLEFDAEAEAEQPQWMEGILSTEVPAGKAVLFDINSTLQPKIEIPAWLEAMEEEPEVEPLPTIEEGGAPVSAVDLGEAPGARELESAEAADMEPAGWMDEEDAGSEPPTEELVSGEMPQWLSELASETGVEGAVTEAEAVPEWLAGMAPEEAIADIPVVDETAAVVEMPDVESALPAETQAPALADIPDWLAALASEDAGEAASVAEVGEEYAQRELAATEPAEMPEWLAELAQPSGRLEEELSEEEIAELETAGTTESSWTEGAEVPDWLADLALEESPSAEGVPAAELSEQPLAEESAESEPAEIPDWLEELKAEAAQEVAADVPAWLAGYEPEGSSEAQVEVPEWLSGLAKEPVEEAQVPETPADVPEWLVQVRSETAREETELDADIVTELPEWLQEEGVPTGDQALAWLEELAAGKEEELDAQMAAEGEARMAETMARAEPEEPVSEEPVSEEEAEEAVFGWTSMGATGGPVAIGPLAEESVARSDEVSEPEVLVPAETTEEPAVGGTSIGAEEGPVAIGPVVDESAVFTEVEETLAQPVAGISAAEAGLPLEEAPEGVEVQPVGLESDADLEFVEAIAVEEAPVEDLELLEEPKVGVQPGVSDVKDVQVAGESAEDSFAEERLRVASNPRDYDAWLLLARGLWDTGEHDESLEAYERLIKAGKQIDDVVEDLEEIVTQSPAAEVRRILGDAYMKKGRLQEALDIYRTALNNL